MKKAIVIVAIILVVFGAVFLIRNMYVKNKTLIQIVNKFNTSSIVDDYKSVGGTIKAVRNSNKINIEATSGEETVNIEFALNGNILSAEVNGKDFMELIISMDVIDIIGQLSGYEEDELKKTLNSDKATNYTLETEGFETEKLSEEKIRISIDITKKIPLVDFSNIYIEVSDLEMHKERISGDGSAEKSKGNIWFNKSGYDGKYTLLIAEKGELTENTYKSLLSILEVMFENDKVLDYFKKNYPNISSGDKEFDGFSIVVNPEEKTNWEEMLVPDDSGYILMRITIDKSLAISSVN